MTSAIARYAAPRHGVLDLDELHACGLGARGAQHRAATGELHRLYDRVYAVGHRGIGVDGLRRAAVLACGRDAALSHRSAGAFWGICANDPLAFHVTTPPKRRVSRRGIVLHVARAITEADRLVRRHIPLTSVAWTLVDLAGVLSAQELERAVQEAEVLRLVDVGAVLEVLGRSRGRRGTGTLRRILAESAAGVTRSELEARFTRLCRGAGLPLPRLNARVAGFEVDALWPTERVIVELDGARFHRTRRGFEQDRRRDAALVATGYVVIRLTWRRLTEDARGVADELRRILALRGVES